jgi:hypothetical protein
MGYTLTYAGLVAELQDIVEDTGPEFVANLPKIIARAQDQVQRDLGLAIWRRFESNSVDFNKAEYPRQGDWLQILSVHFPTLVLWPEQRGLDWVRSFGSATGKPRYWCEVNESAIRFAPIPDQNYPVEIEVMKKLPSLSSTNPTNWISENAADLLLLASLIGCEVYLASSDRMKEFMSLYQTLLDGAVRDLREGERSRYEPVRASPKPTLQPGASA